MCTVVPRHCKPRIAKEDIETYKLCREVPGGVSSALQTYFYKADVIEKAEISFVNYAEYFNDKEGDYLETLSNPRFIQDGFHSSIKRENLDNFYLGSCRLCRFIIPKGSKYYKSGIGMVVSNQIIFKEIIK